MEGPMHNVVFRDEVEQDLSKFDISNDINNENIGLEIIDLEVDNNSKNQEEYVIIKFKVKYL
jgi:hypothetical protein